MNKAILLCASIGWQTIYDEKGRPKARHIGVSVSWMPYEISYKRCGFNHHISAEYADLMRREPQRIEMMVDHIARCFASAAAKLMEQHHADPSDMSEACEELRRGLPDGFRSFLENDKIWIHHFNQVLNVSKGSRYRAGDGEWYEAEEDAMIVVRCCAGEQIMTQAEYERMKQKGGLTMKAEVVKIDVPVGTDVAIPAYRVDIEDYQVIGYHESTTRKATYNVYEQEAVANYVANAINKGEIIPYMMEIDHSYPED